MITYNVQDELQVQNTFFGLKKPLTNDADKLPGYYGALREGNMARSTLTNMNRRVSSGPQYFLKRGQGMIASHANLLGSEGGTTAAMSRVPMPNQMVHPSSSSGHRPTINQSQSGTALGYLSLDKGSNQRIAHMTEMGFSQANFANKQSRSVTGTNRGIKSAGHFTTAGPKPPMYPNSSRPTTNGDPRARHRDQIQKNNRSFYGTLNANVMNRDQYEKLVSSNKAQSLVAPHFNPPQMAGEDQQTLGGSNLMLDQKQQAYDQQAMPLMTNQTAYAKHGEATSRQITVQAQAFKGTNLKYHLIRRLLEQKTAAEIFKIKKDLEGGPISEDALSNQDLDIQTQIQCGGQVHSIGNGTEKLNYLNSPKDQLSHPTSASQKHGIGRRQVYGSRQNSQNVIGNNYSASTGVVQTQSLATQELQVNNKNTVGNDSAITVQKGISTGTRNLTQNAENHNETLRDDKTSLIQIKSSLHQRSQSGSSSSSSEDEDDVVVEAPYDPNGKSQKGDSKSGNQKSKIGANDKDQNSIADYTDPNLQNSKPPMSTMDDPLQIQKTPLIEVKQAGDSGIDSGLSEGMSAQHHTMMHNMGTDASANIHSHISHYGTKPSQSANMALTTRPYVYRGAPDAYQADQRGIEIREKLKEQDQADKIQSKKGLACKRFHEKTKESFNQQRKINMQVASMSEALGNPEMQLDVADLTTDIALLQKMNEGQNNLLRSGQGLSASATRLPGSIPRDYSKNAQNQHLGIALKELTRKKNYIHQDTNMITSALDYNNRSQNLSVSKLGSGQGVSNSVAAIARMKLTSQEVVIDSVNQLATRIKDQGICDNKKVKPPKQNIYYQTLEREKEDREKLMSQLIRKPKSKNNQENKRKTGIIHQVNENSQDQAPYAAEKQNSGKDMRMQGSDGDKPGMFDLSVEESTKKFY